MPPAGRHHPRLGVPALPRHLHLPRKHASVAQRHFGHLQKEPPEGAVLRQRARPGEAAKSVGPERVPAERPSRLRTEGAPGSVRAPAAAPHGSLHEPVEGVLPAGGAACSGTQRFPVSSCVLSRPG